MNAGCFSWLLAFFMFDSYVSHKTNKWCSLEFWLWASNVQCIDFMNGISFAHSLIRLKVRRSFKAEAISSFSFHLISSFGEFVFDSEENCAQYLNIFFFSSEIKFGFNAMRLRKGITYLFVYWERSISLFLVHPLHCIRWYPFIRCHIPRMGMTIITKDDNSEIKFIFNNCTTFIIIFFFFGFGKILISIRLLSEAICVYSLCL